MDDSVCSGQNPASLGSFKTLYFVEAQYIYIYMNWQRTGATETSGILLVLKGPFLVSAAGGDLGALADPPDLDPGE